MVKMEAIADAGERRLTRGREKQMKETWERANERGGLQEGEKSK
jgi:hypothetical protein